MLKTIITSFTADPAEWLIYAAIAIVTLSGFFRCIFPVMRNASALNHATIRLEKGVVEGKNTLWMDKNFLGKTLQNEWHEFLSGASQLGKRGVGCDTRDYVNEDSVIDKPGHAQLADLIPGLLTSLGILGTFVGLILGLSGVDFSSTSGTMDSIHTLLTGMKTAFYTSVAGIACSLTFNMVNRIVIGKAHRALDNFDDAFSQLVMPRPLQADLAMLCEKKDEDARMAQLFTGLSSQMTASIENSVGRAMVPLTRSLNEFIHCATQEQVEGIRQAAGQFVYQMNTYLSDQMRSLGDVMSQATQSQLRTQANVEASLSMIDAVNRQTQAITNAYTQTVESLNQYTESLKKQQESSLLNVESYSFSASELEKQLKGLSDSIARMQTAMEKVTASMETPEEAEKA